MVYEPSGSNPSLGAEVLIEFNKSIQNIQEFGEVMEQLDARFGSIEQRIDSMRNSLSSLSSEVNRGSGDNLRRNLENELNSIALANGVALTSVGTAPFKIKQETVRHIFRRIDAELNRAIAKSIGDIVIQLDPSFSNGQFVLGKSEFEAFNKEVARLVRTHVRQLTTSLNKNGIEIVSPDALQGLQFDISRDTVKGILSSIKRQITPMLLNPTLAETGEGIKISKRELREVMNKVKQRILESVDINLDGIGKGAEKRGTARQLTRELQDVLFKIDGLVSNYILGIRTELSRMDGSELQVPLANMSQALKRHIARDLGISVQKLEQTFQTLSVQETVDYELRRQIQSLERVVTQKLTSGTSKIMTELKRTVRAVEIRPQSTLHDYLIREIRKINAEIIAKIREQVDLQFRAIRDEIRDVRVPQGQLRRSGRIERMARDYRRLEGGSPPIDRQPTVTQSQPRRTVDSRFGSDPFARRDAHFAQFGLQGAVINTFRHILAGSMVGAPIMAVYQALDTFKQSQLEQLKILQNFMLKDDFQLVDSEGNKTGSPDFGKIERELANLVPVIKELSVFYAVDYQDMSKVAGIASRLTNTVEEARQFMDYATAIQRLDSEGDLVETIAPGFEAIMGQFGKSVWQMDEAVRAFAVATNRTKTTTDELMNALMRSGSSLKQGGMSITDSAIFSALAVQLTGLSGENIGNMTKTIMTRLTLPTTQKVLEEYGIEVYEQDDRGRNIRRDAVELLTEIANMVKLGKMGDDELDRIFYATAGGYQISKFLAFIENFNDLDIEGDDTLNFHKLREQALTMTDEQVDEMLAKTLTSTVHNMNRASAATNVALVSVLEEMRPQIDDLMSVITNLANGIRDNADMIAELISVLGNMLLGFSAVIGVRKLGKMGGYPEIDQRNRDLERIRGGAGTAGVINTLAPVLSTAVIDQLNNRKFMVNAMKDSTLAPYLRELANMDEMRQRELVNYLRENNPKNLAELLVSIDESRGFMDRGRERRRISPDTYRERAQYSIERLSRNSVFSPEFARDFSNIFSNRENFLQYNASSENRRTTRRLANMSDLELRAFEESLTRSGRSIQNINQLNEALSNFSRLQAHANFNNLASSIDNVARASSANVFTNAQQGFMGFLNDLPRKARSGAEALGNLARNLGRLGLQMAAFYAIGDVISTGTQIAIMTDAEKEVQQAKHQLDVGDHMYRTTARFKMGLYGSPSEMLQQGLRGMVDWGKLTFGSIKNIIYGEGTALGWKEAREFANEFYKWLEEEHGKAVKRIIKTTGKHGDKTLDHYVSEFLNSTGKYEEVNEAERELFKERAKQARLDEIEIQKYREEVEEAQRATELAYLERGEYSYFSTQHLKEAIQEQLDEFNEAWELDKLNMILDGHKTYSDEYYNLMQQRIDHERELLQETLKGLREFIEEKEKILAEMREQGLHEEVDKETGEVKKSEEYAQHERTLEEEKNKLANLEKDFSRRFKELDKEEAELSLQRVMTQSSIRMRDANHEKALTDIYNSLTLDRSSKEYRDAQIASNLNHMERIRKELERLRSIEFDPDGELRATIQSLEQALASHELAIRDLRVASLTNYRQDLQDFDSLQELEILQAQLSLGTTDLDHPAIRAIRRSQVDERVNEIEKIMQNLIAEFGDDTDPEIIRGLERELVELQKQSLRAQLSLLDEVKKSNGTFNLPEGFKPMSEFDYMKSLGTHSSYSISAGDMHVQVILPNITNMTSAEQMKVIGQSFAEGMMNGKLSSYRHMINSGPWGYKNPKFMGQ